jgi:hypothetical protein
MIAVKPLRQWRWGTLSSYNGFCHAERVRGWQLISWLGDNGWSHQSDLCCISGQSGKPSLHSENYYSWTPYTLDHSIHMALHRRFKQPAPWLRIVDKFSTTGAEWFARLPMTPDDIAAPLRAKYGPEIMDIFNRVPVPPGVSIPHSQIYQRAAS